MKYFVGVTNNNWFNYLSQIQPDEVNFWRPGKQPFSAIEVGSPFLFKLHSPLNFVVGGGYFVRYEKLPLILAWEAFGNKNGVPNIYEFRRVIQQLGNTNEFNPQIGCIILNNPFFFLKKDWIQVPKDFSTNIVSGKSYDTRTAEGNNLWYIVKRLLVGNTSYERIGEKKPDYEIENRYGLEYLMKARLGQGAFRVLVTSAYHRQCAITGEKTLPALEAAHIKPFAQSGPNRVNNGLLLRSDIHKLFDAGYLTITEDHKIEVSRRIKEEFENGKNYYPFHGKELFILPDLDSDRPNREFLEWHNSEIFLG